MSAIAFDLDGTLADTMPGLTDLAVEIMTKFWGITPSHARARYLDTIGRPFLEQLEMLFPDEEKRRVREAADMYFTRKWEAWLEAPLHEDALRITTLCALGGASVFVCSSTEKDLVQRYVMKHRLPVTVPHGVSKQDQLLCIDNQFEDWVPRHLIGDAPYDHHLAETMRFHFTGVAHTLSAEVWSAPPGVAVKKNLAGVYDHLFSRELYRAP